MSTNEITVTPTRKKGGLAYSVNPFNNETVIKLSGKTITIGDSVIIETQIDESEFINAYINEMKKTFELKKTSLLILAVIIELSKGVESLGEVTEKYTPRLSFDIISNWKFFPLKIEKVSRTTYHRAINELIDKGFIAESETQDRYWINYNLIKLDTISLTRTTKIKGD